VAVLGGQWRYQGQADADATYPGMVVMSLTSTAVVRVMPALPKS
jgi:hypothetical protein